MAYASNDGVRLHFEVEGDGPPLVLQHGSFFSIDRWRSAGYVDALKSEYKLILTDARGHGGSDKPHDPQAYDLEILAGDILAVLDELNETNANFWGFSMGGQYAYGLAKFAPERLQSLIIGASHPYGRTAPKGLTGDDPEGFISGILGRMGIDFSQAPARERAAMLNNDFHAIAACFRDRAALDDILPEVKVPCLLYIGDNDGGLEKVKSCAELLPRSQIQVLPGLNHMEAFSRSDLVLPRAKSFLNDVKAGRA